METEYSNSENREMRPTRFYGNDLKSDQRLESQCSTERDIQKESYRNSMLTMTSNEGEEGQNQKDKKKVSLRSVDIVLEYVERLYKVLKKVDEKFLTKPQRDLLLYFIMHNTWVKKDTSILVSSG